MNRWYQINHVHDIAHVRIFDDIGYNGPDASEFLLDLDRAPKVELRINSIGGCSKTAVALYNELRKRDTTCLIDGRAYSSAAIIAMAARRIEMTDGSTLMLHYPQGAACGGPELMRMTATVLEGFGEPFIEAIVRRTGHPVATVKRWLARDSYFTAAEAIHNRLADHVIPAPRRESAKPAQAITVSAGDVSAVPPMHDTERTALEILQILGPIRTTNRGRLARELSAWLGTVHEA